MLLFIYFLDRNKVYKSEVSDIFPQAAFLRIVLYAIIVFCRDLKSFAQPWPDTCFFSSAPDKKGVRWRRKKIR